jgi:hypothetical protein
LSFDPGTSPKKQIGNLLATLFSGVVCAFLVALAMLYFYSPNGNYLAQNALLAPDVIEQLNPKNATGKNKSPLFERFEYSYQDYETKKRTLVPIDKEQYAKFYSTVFNDKSLDEVPPNAAADFDHMPAANLDLITTVDKNAQIFQTIQFLYRGNYYRIQLRESSPSGNWIYFQHPDIYNDTFNLFTKKSS